MDVVLLVITWLVFLANEAAGGRYQECPKGWTKVESKCFKLVHERNERTDAQRRCRNRYSASLAVIENEEENKVVQDLLDGQSSAWIGLRHGYREYYWDGENKFRYVYSNWRSGRRSYGDCVRIFSSGEWQRASCYYDINYVCFKKADCEPGWTGDVCDRQCHCYKGYACNGTDACPYGCELGWTGQMCDAHTDKPEVSFYCMREQEDFSLKLKLDLKGIPFSNYGAVNAEGEISPKCDKDVHMHGLYAQIRNVSGVWESDCPFETAGRDVLRWTFRLQKNSGVVSFEDVELQVECDLSQADAAYDGTGRVRVEGLRERTVKAATLTRISPRTYLADPETLEPVTNVSLGVPVRLVAKFPEGDDIVNPFFKPRNCQAASPDGKVTVQLTDDSGCSLRRDIGFGEMDSISRMLQSMTFPMFHLPGYKEVVFTCTFVPSSRVRFEQEYCPWRG